MTLRIKILFLALLACVAFLAVKNIYSCELSLQIDKGIYKAAKLGEITNLYIGSSMFGRGININEAEKVGPDSFILAYNGFDPTLELLVIEYLIKHNTAIKNLYLDMYAYSAAQESKLAESRMIFDSPLSLKIALWQTITRNQENYLALTWELFISSGNDIFLLWPLYKKLVANRYHKGATLGNLSGTTREILDSTPVPQTGTGNINNLQKEAITKIIKLCREHNINLVFIETPKFFDTINSGIYSSIMQEYINLLRENEAKYFISQELINRLNISGTGYKFSHSDPSLFIDHIHLSTLGSIEFTRLMTSRIN
ncbi:MAG: hypothetical protein IJS99_02675 [Synergistaceae bacterium]|nr:hypothetical protein [Synergistaceae bacterium]